jgi:hypothetical protein
MFPMFDQNLVLNIKLFEYGGSILEFKRKNKLIK